MNELDETCFAHLAKRMVSDKILKDTPYKIALNPKYDAY